MYRYLVIDGMLNGTGIRDYYEGGYIQPSDLNLSLETVDRLKNWLEKYWAAFYEGYSNKAVVKQLDNEGVSIAEIVKNELEGKVWYYSDAEQNKLQV